MVGAGNFSLNCVQIGSYPIQSPIKWVLGALSLGHEANHPPLSSAKVKSVWCYTSTPHHVFMEEFYLYILTFVFQGKWDP